MTDKEGEVEIVARSILDLLEPLEEKEALQALACVTIITEHYTIAFALIKELNSWKHEGT